jgi:hypothetical protein
MITVWLLYNFKQKGMRKTYQYSLSNISKWAPMFCIGCSLQNKPHEHRTIERVNKKSLSEILGYGGNLKHCRQIKHLVLGNFLPVLTI